MPCIEAGERPFCCVYRCSTCVCQILMHCVQLTILLVLVHPSMFPWKNPRYIAKSALPYVCTAQGALLSMQINLHAALQACTGMRYAEVTVCAYLCSGTPCTINHLTISVLQKVHLEPMNYNHQPPGVMLHSPHNSYAIRSGSRADSQEYREGKAEAGAGVEVGDAMVCSRTAGCAKAAGHQGFCSGHKGFRRRFFEDTTAQASG